MNAGVLMLVAGSWLPPGAAATPAPGFGVGQATTFVTAIPGMPAAAPRAPKTDKQFHFYALAGLFHSGGNAFTGGIGASFTPLKDQDKIDVQVDALFYKTTTTTFQYSYAGGVGGSTSSSLGLLISIDVLYQIEMQSMKGWMLGVGGGVGINHAGGTAAVGEIVLALLRERANGGNLGLDFRLLFRGGTSELILFRFGF